MSDARPDLDRYDAVLLDLDGTVYRIDHPLPGAVELIRRLQREGRPFACLSNSTSSPQRITARLHRMGVTVEPCHIYTAAAAAVDWVIDDVARRSPGRRPRVFNLSGDGVQDLLEERADFVPLDEALTVPPTGRADCDAVIVGTPREVHATDDRQRGALYLLRFGARLVGTSPDRVYPSGRGLEFGAGALATMLACAADVEPFFTGKPHRVFFETLCQRLRVDPARCILIGDNLESDIAGGRGVGMATALTLTGITLRHDLDALPADRRPDYVIDSLAELL